MDRILLAACAAILVMDPVLAEPEPVTPATYASLDVESAADSVAFTKRATVRGDRIDQSLDVSLSLESTVREKQEIVEKSSTSLERQQERTVIAEEIADGRTVAARVRFAKCDRTVDGGTPEQQPIVGHTYLCRRMSDDTLEVTREDGSFPTPDEFQIIAESMESLGRPNPLANFLAGQTLTVGQKLRVPEEVGAQLLGSDGSLGTVSKFELTLKQIVLDEHQKPVARFSATIQTTGSHKTQMRLEVMGTIDVEADSCRTRSMHLSGPLGMATTSGSYSQAQTTFVRGKLVLDMAASYTDRAAP